MSVYLGRTSGRTSVKLYSPIAATSRYSQHCDCPETFLTDYRSGIALEFEPAPNRSGDHVVRACPAEELPHQALPAAANPIEYGLRHALCFLAFKALVRLGLVSIPVSAADGTGTFYQQKLMRARRAWNNPRLM